MSDLRRKDLENLSAYLDDDSSIDPEEVESILRENAELSSRHEQWSAISEAMRDMPQPEVEAAFHTRTMAAIREIEPAPKAFPWQWPVGVGALIAAGIAAVVFFSSQSTTPITDTSEEAFADAEEVEYVLAERLDASEDYTSELAMEYGVDTWEDEIVYIDEEPEPVEDEVAELGSLLASFESAVTDDLDIDHVVSSVDTRTEEELKLMMLAYADEELYL